jgi:hypothetical protein
MRRSAHRTSRCEDVFRGELAAIAIADAKRQLREGASRIGCGSLGAMKKAVKKVGNSRRRVEKRLSK